MVEPYEVLLKKAYTHVTEPSESHERFMVPEAKSYIEGKTTVLENFAEISNIARRDPDHLMKFLLGELGTAGKIDGNRAIFNGKFENSLIVTLIRNYVEDYVICSECGKPDTRLVKDDRFLLLRCDACGGHRPVKKRKARTEAISNELQEGAVLEVEIQSVSKRGDGVVKMGKYIMYVANAKPGQKVKVRISRISGSIVFTERAVI
ncbi:MAG: translation initiation factor IF-2 subunit beta [Methanoregulaceae archaeon]|nr:translation initiation factor IF-2 subunit beta [Methanoregulaceae archaeon]